LKAPTDMKTSGLRRRGRSRGKRGQYDGEKNGAVGKEMAPPPKGDGQKTENILNDGGRP